MRIDSGQYMRMEQRMKLSPRMIQSMEILQLPTMALEERIEQELEQNPVLELREPAPAPGSENADEREQADRTPEEERPMLAHDSEAGQSTSEDFQRLSDYADSEPDTWSQNVNESSEYRPTIRYDGERDAKMDAMANTAARTDPLVDQLLDQWRYVDVPDDIRKIGEHLIGYIDDDGYLRTPMDDVVRMAPPGVTIPRLEQALVEIQHRLEPTGIGARDLRECLLLQIEALLNSDELEEERDEDELKVARVLVTDYLKDIEMNRLPRIEKAAGLTMDQIKRGLLRLRHLDPHPGRKLAPETSQVITPDVMIEYDPVHDQYVAALNRGRQPSLRISPQYQQMAKDREAGKETRQFLTRNVHNARWLIDSINQRNNTVLRVVRAVLDAQRDFFDMGERHLKPLPMIQVADQLGIHVGTVSRAVSEKYLQTPRGIFPLRMFFSGGTESDSGEEMSWAAVQAKLKEIIDAEDKNNPLSDDALADEMKAQGVEIARRTVAKYRQQMNIAPARKRRQF